MKVSGNAIENIKSQIEADKMLSVLMRAEIDLLLLIVTLLCHRLGLNSHKLSSSDPNRNKTSNANSNRQSSGQKGHTLEQDLVPDITHILTLFKALLSPDNYPYFEKEARQFVDIEFKRVVTEYRVQIVKDEFGKRFGSSSQLT